MVVSRLGDPGARGGCRLRKGRARTEVRGDGSSAGLRGVDSQSWRASLSSRLTLIAMKCFEMS